MNLLQWLLRCVLSKIVVVHTLTYYILAVLLYESYSFSFEKQKLITKNKENLWIFSMFFKSRKAEGCCKVERSIVFQFQCIKEHIITDDNCIWCIYNCFQSSFLNRESKHYFRKIYDAYIIIKLVDLDMWLKVLHFCLVISSQVLGQSQCYSGPIVWTNCPRPGRSSLSSAGKNWFKHDFPLVI